MNISKKFISENVIINSQHINYMGLCVPCKSQNHLLRAKNDSMDKKARQQVVKQAIANERLEGLEVTKETKKIANDYICGKLSAKEAANKIRARYGVL